MAIIVLKGAIILRGKIKIFSKAIMLNHTLTFSAVLLISAAATLLANNLFVAAEYLFSFLKESKASPFFTGQMKTVSLAVIYGLCIFLSVTLVSPLKFSRDIWFYETSKKDKTKLRRMLFSYRPHWFFRCAALRFTLLFVKLIWSLLYFLPCIALSGYLVYSLQSGISKTMLLLVSASIAISFLSGSFFSFVTFQRYSLCHVMFYENDGISALEAVRRSAQLMDESCFALAKLKLSFVGWMISCLLILPVFYVYPYYKISVAYFLNNVLVNGGAA